MQTTLTPKLAPSSQDAIEQVVEIEARRRRRVFLVYLALLIVPIVAAGIALAWGRSEREVIAPKVQEAILPDVQREVTDRLRPQVDAIVAERAEPVVARLVSEEVAPAMKRLDTAMQLGSEVASIRTDLAAVNGRLDRFGEAAETIRAIDPQLLRQLPEAAIAARKAAEEAAASRSEVERLRREQETLRKDVEAMSRQLVVLRKEFDGLNGVRPRPLDVKPLDVRPVRPPEP